MNEARRMTTREIARVANPQQVSEKTEEQTCNQVESQGNQPLATSETGKSEENQDSTSVALMH